MRKLSLREVLSLTQSQHFYMWSGHLIPEAGYDAVFASKGKAGNETISKCLQI